MSCSPFCVTVWVTGPFPTAAEFLTHRAKDFSSVVQGTLNRWLNSNDTERTALRHCIYWKNKWINEQIEIHFCCISSAGPFPWGYQNEWVFEHAFGSIHQLIVCAWLRCILHTHEAHLLCHSYKWYFKPTLPIQVLAWGIFFPFRRKQIPLLDRYPREMKTYVYIKFVERAQQHHSLYSPYGNSSTSINQRANEVNVAYPSHGTVLGHKTQWSTNTSYNMEETGEPCATWKKPVTEDPI